jgi:molybdate transport system substrate-binding protein
MNRTWLLLIGSIAVAALCFVLLRQPANSTSNVGKLNTNTTPVHVFCAAANRTVLELIRADYEKEFGKQVEIQYGSSQAILSSVEVSERGDLLIPSDDSFMAIAAEKKLIAEVLPLASMRPVIGVRKGNPQQIHQLSDLLRKGVRLVQANTEATAIGKLTREVLSNTGEWESLKDNTIAFRTTVSEAAADVAVGAADAAIVFDVVVKGNEDLEAIEIASFRDKLAQVSVGVLASTTQPQAALHFARYLASKDRGLLHFADQGFVVSGGDSWSDVPALTLFAGSMLRPAVDDTLTRFEQREGVRITRVYNGCGILVAQMKSGQKPDGYFACDREFMKEVPDLFPHPFDVSTNRLVILVQKGNPHGIRDLKDLGKPGLRVGIGHEKQCAMGWLTQNVLREGGVMQEVMTNVTVQTPTGDMLVNQLQAGALDAAVAYITNAAGKGDLLDAVQIQGIKCSVATQPFAIAEQSNHAMTMSRLLDSIQSAESKEIFLAEGFSWHRDSLAPSTSSPTSVGDL